MYLIPLPMSVIKTVPGTQQMFKKKGLFNPKSLIDSNGGNGKTFRIIAQHKIDQDVCPTAYKYLHTRLIIFET